MKTIIIILSALLCQYIEADAQSPHPYSDALFSYITVENGLPNNFVNDIYKDSRGFIWISTYGGGLLRYDGYDFKNFNTRTAVPIKSNFADQCVEDNFHRLWIASEGGIDIIDLDYGTECSKTVFANHPDNLLHQHTYMITKDSRGSIYAAVGLSVFKADFASDGSISSISRLNPQNNPTIPITAIYEYDGQILQVSTTLYLNLLPTTTATSPPRCLPPPCKIFRAII